MAQNKKDNYQNNEFVQDNEPFKDDLLDREKIAQLWQDTLLKSGKHFVMAVDASWGMGKSYFARNWECKLLNDDYKVCYIDAFEYDFTDDPFMTITSNLIEAFEFKDLDEVANKLNVFIRTFKNQSLENMPLLVEGGMQVLINQAAPILNTPTVNGIAKFFSGITKIFTKSIQESSKATINPMDKVVDKDKNYSQVLLEFKNLLKEKTAELVGQTRQATVGEIIENNSNTIKQDTKPLIVIVDELDRCKPTYAIEFLEKLKHLFDIPNMIFILFINRDELESIIKGRYGQTYDGLNYLNKFIPITVSFPTSLAQNDELYDSFIKEQIRKLSISQSGSFAPDNNGIFVSGFVMDRYSEIIRAMLELIKHMQIKYNLSLRDIKQLFNILDYVDVKHEIDYAVIMSLRIIYLKDLILFKQIKNYELENINNIYAGLLQVSKVDLIERVNVLYKGSREKKVFTDILIQGDNSYRIENPRDYFNKMITFVESLY